ncbi:hypothetical protein [Streptomyces sp. NBC_00620]|uniref:hypothetical protein n=1 Tax=Streptomyces sp. NBC_00620 TaxID=2903666 RepID=UPI002251CE59|nr:hypothetical protein [Streptomyces sp. NBC_00620]MCX4976508.1 hypothetical protein [Streptomyces sp. NBC_00620]
MTTATDPSAPPDCTAALQAWRHAYQKRNADRVFLRRLEALRDHVNDLLATAPTNGEPFTFEALFRMPQPAQDFYSELIDASESLAELIADHNPMRTAYRHAALVLIGDALGALRDDKMTALIAACGCGECREQLRERLATGETREGE